MNQQAKLKKKYPDENNKVSIRMKTSPSKLNGSQFSDSTQQNKSFTSSKDRSQLKSPQMSKYEHNVSDLKMDNLQLSMELKDLQIRFNQNQLIYGDFEVQYQCMKELIIFQRQNIDQQKTNNLDAESQIQIIRNELECKEHELDNITELFQKQNQHVQELEQIISQQKKDSQQQLEQDTEIKRLRLYTKEIKRELIDSQKKLQSRDYQELLLQIQVQKEKVMVLQEVNDILKEQLWRSSSATNHIQARKVSRSPQSTVRASTERGDSEQQAQKLQISLLQQNVSTLENLQRQKQGEYTQKEKQFIEKIILLENQSSKNDDNWQLYEQIHRLQDNVIQLKGQLSKKNINQEKKSITPKAQKIDQQLATKVERELNHKSNLDGQQQKSQSIDQANVITNLRKTVANQINDIINLKNQIIKHQEKDNEMSQQVIILQQVQKDFSRLQNQANGMDLLVEENILVMKLQTVEYEQKIQIINAQMQDVNERNSIQVDDLQKQCKLLQVEKEDLQQQLQLQSQPKVMVKSRLQRQESDNLLFTSSDDDDHAKLKFDKGYYKQEFDDLLEKYQENNQTHLNRQVEVDRKNSEILMLKSQIVKLEDGQLMAQENGQYNSQKSSQEDDLKLNLQSKSSVIMMNRLSENVEDQKDLQKDQNKAQVDLLLELSEKNLEILALKQQIFQLTEQQQVFQLTGQPQPNQESEILLLKQQVSYLTENLQSYQDIATQQDINIYNKDQIEIDQNGLKKRRFEKQQIQLDIQDEQNELDLLLQDKILQLQAQFLELNADLMDF